MGGVQHAWPPDHDDSGSGASCGMRHSATLTNVFTLQDVDLYVRQCRPTSLVVIMLCGVVASIAQTFLPPLVHGAKLGLYAYGIVLVPLVYFGFRWRQIVEMQKGFPLLTEMLTLILAVKLAAMAAPNLVTVVDHRYQGGHFRNPVAVVVYFIGAACTLFAHRWSKRRGEGPTLRFYTAAFVYLFMAGTGYLATVLYAKYVHQFSYVFAAWCIGPIHMVSSRLPSSVIS
jgi:hypothetical protein